MCLTFVRKTFGENNECKVKYGWKVFRKFDGKLYPEIVHSSTPYKTDEWLTCKSRVKTLESYYHTRYKIGFHVFATRQGARDWKEINADTVIRKVEMQDVVHLGLQNRDEVYIAKRIKIISSSRG